MLQPKSGKKKKKWIPNQVEILLTFLKKDEVYDWVKEECF